MSLIVDMGVNLCCQDRTVAKEMLDVPDIHPITQKLSGHSVAEHVGCDMPVDRRLPNPSPDHEADGLLGYGEGRFSINCRIGVPWFHRGGSKK